MTEERRRFSRFHISGDAIVFDQQGRQLGTVEVASGGGMGIRTPSEEIARQLQSERRVQVTIMEPATNSSHTIDVVVRSREGSRVGVEFLTGENGGQ